MSCISKLAQYGVLAMALAGAPAIVAQTDRGQSTAAPAASPTTTAPGTGANGAATVPPANPDNPYNNGNVPNNGGGHNFGWIELVGLLGLIGLKKGGRRDTTVTHDDRVNPGM